MNISEIKELLAGTPTAEQLATLAADEQGIRKRRVKKHLP